MRQPLQIEDMAGIRALLVHAKDETARNFDAILGAVYPDLSNMLYCHFLADYQRLAEIAVEHQKKLNYVKQRIIGAAARCE